MPLDVSGTGHFFCVRVHVYASEEAGFFYAHTHTGHQSAVNFRLSRGTATKSIIEVMNALLGTGISV